MSNARHPCVKNRKNGCLGYRFIRLLANKPPKPNSVPMTRVLGSGTAGGGGGGGGGGADEDRLATRKPMTLTSPLGTLTKRDDDDRLLEKKLSQKPPRYPREEEPLLLARSPELSSHS
jgi:hypothetical protein